MPEILRMRVFAGPNGSGKSTVINSIRHTTVNGIPIDFGTYINADDIAVTLQEGSFSFDTYSINTTAKEFRETAIASGLVDADFNTTVFDACYSFRSNAMRLRMAAGKDRLAQIIADFLRKKLLAERRKFSFETVFSHESKLQIMRDAVAAGYKVYLYFISTESAEINVYRVNARKAKGGHNVPEDKIRSRYTRSLNLLYDASQLAYQAFYFDNSEDGTTAAMFAHFKKSGQKKEWDDIREEDIPQWFRLYYADKVK